MKNVIEKEKFEGTLSKLQMGKIMGAEGPAPSTTNTVHHAYTWDVWHPDNQILGDSYPDCCA